MDYSIIIPAYNEALTLPPVLKTISQAMESVAYSGELIVVDNNSSDNTASVAGQYGATVVFEAYNQISRARNSGAQVARGRWLIFIDADTIIHSDLIKRALSNLNSDSIVGGGATVKYDRSLDQIANFLVHLWTFFSVNLRLAAGSFIYVRRDAFEAVGGFSEKVYASEEIWLSKALKKWGKYRKMEFVIIPEPPVVTSSRKLNWFGSKRLLAALIFYTIFPFALRSRSLCRIWYHRPIKTK